MNTDSNNNEQVQQDSLPIELQRFFGYCNIDNDQISNEALSFNSDVTFLIGPTKTCKTSLLFQYGYSYTKQGYSVLYICDKKRFNTALPMLANYEKFSNNNVHLKHMKIKYLEKDFELRNYLMEFPSLNLIPDIILIDDFTHYFGMNLHSDRTKSILGRTLGFLKDTLLYINRQRPYSNFKCKAIISDTDSYYYITQRWASLVLQIQNPLPPIPTPTTSTDINFKDIDITTLDTITTTTTASTTTNKQPVNIEEDRKLNMIVKKYNHSHKIVNLQFTVLPSISTFKLDSIQFKQLDEQQQQQQNNNDNINDNVNVVK